MDAERGREREKERIRGEIDRRDPSTDAALQCTLIWNSSGKKDDVCLSLIPSSLPSFLPFLSGLLPLNQSIAEERAGKGAGGVRSCNSSSSIAPKQWEKKEQDKEMKPCKWRVSEEHFPFQNIPHLCSHPPYHTHGRFILFIHGNPHLSPLPFIKLIERQLQTLFSLLLLAASTCALDFSRLACSACWLSSGCCCCRRRRRKAVLLFAHCHVNAKCALLQPQECVEKRNVEHAGGSNSENDKHPGPAEKIFFPLQIREFHYSTSRMRTFRRIFDKAKIPGDWDEKNFADDTSCSLAALKLPHFEMARAISVLLEFYQTKCKKRACSMSLINTSLSFSPSTSFSSRSTSKQSGWERLPLA